MEGLIDEIRGHLEAPAAVRRAAASGSLRALLAAAMEAGDQPARAGARPPAPSPDSLARSIGALPTELALPLADLAATVVDAVRVVEQAVPDRIPASRVVGVGTHRSEDGYMFAEPSLVVTDARGTDMAAVNEAALRIAGSLDRTLPALRAYAATLPSAPPSDEECDVLDLSPYVCVADTGSNTHTTEQMLLVDLGGDDRYESSAGGARAFSQLDGGDQHPVSVVVDLDGDDHYEHVIPRDRLTVSQGSAFHGIGFLIDAAGDDVYIRRAAPGDARTDLQGAQGFGAEGVGLLADLGGNDSYTVYAYDGESSNHQGAGNGGVGVLLDAEGDDNFEVVGGTATAFLDPGGVPQGTTRQAMGQGIGLAPKGFGVLVDLGGADQFSLTAETDDPLGLREYPSTGTVPRNLVMGQGHAIFGGTGMLLTGEGPTTYRAWAQGNGFGLHWVFAQGSGWNGGASGILEDRGGNDRYELGSEMSIRVEHTVDEQCGCDGAEAVLDATRVANPQNVAGQGTLSIPIFGFGTINVHALGLLADHGGDDVYRAVQSGSVEAVAAAEGPGQSATAEARSFNAGNFMAQGAAHGVGAGILFDADGDDTYLVELHQRADAQADTEDQDLAEARADAGWRDFGGSDMMDVLAQGAGSLESGLAALVDTGGTDSYEAVLRPEARAHPTLEGASESHNWGTLQGSGINGFLVDLDGEDANRFVSAPNFLPICEGRRGESPMWAECGGYRPGPVAGTASLHPLLGTGVVDSAAERDDAVLSLDADQPVSGSKGDGVVVSGRLIGPDGSPVEGARVDLRLQQDVQDRPAASAILPPELSLTRSWREQAAIHAITDEEGRFGVVLRLQDANPDPEEGPLRLFAGYSGSHELRPATMSMPFTLEG